MLSSQIGPVLKRIRLSKSLTGKYVYEDILSKQSWINLEKGENDTSSDKLFKIIDRLNITLEELHFWKNNFENSDHLFFRDYVKYFNLRDIGALKNILYYCDSNYKRSGNLKFLHFYAMSKLTINFLENSDGDSKDLKVLKNYLSNCERWGYYEIVLFTNTVSFYEMDFINSVYKRIKKQFIKFEQLNRYRNDSIAFLLNIIYLSLLRKEFDNSVFYLKELKSIENNSSNDIYYFMMIEFFEELIKLATQTEYSMDKINNIINIFDYYNLDGKKKQCQEILDILLLNIQ